MTTTPTVPTTLLQAVNEMLQAVSEAAVMTLDTTQTNEDVQKAINTISDVSVSIQSEGWHFNEEQDYPLTPDAVTGEIVLPINCVKCSVAWQSSMRRGTFRQGKLYDLVNHTYVWINSSNGSTTPQPLTGSTTAGAPTSLKADVRFLFAFEDLPQQFRWWIMARAGQMFGVGRVPDQLTFRFTDSVLQDAESKARQYDQDSRGVTVNQTNPHLDYMRRR